MFVFEWCDVKISTVDLSRSPLMYVTFGRREFSHAESLFQWLFFLCCVGMWELVKLKSWLCVAQCWDCYLETAEKAHCIVLDLIWKQQPRDWCQCHLAALGHWVMWATLVGTHVTRAGMAAWAHTREAGSGSDRWRFLSETHPLPTPCTWASWSHVLEP